MRQASAPFGVAPHSGVSWFTGRWRDVRFGARSPHGLHMFCNRLPDPSRLLLCLAVGDQSRAVRPGRRLIPGVPGISGYRESAVG